jgi:hypothetical protein
VKKTGFGFKDRIDETKSSFVKELWCLLLNSTRIPLEIIFLTLSLPTGGLSANKMNFSLSIKDSIRQCTYKRQIKNLQRFRAAGEAKSSLLKKKYGFDRVGIRGLTGSKTWFCIGIFALNLLKEAIMLKSIMNNQKDDPLLMTIR